MSRIACNEISQPHYNRKYCDKLTFLEFETEVLNRIYLLRSKVWKMRRSRLDLFEYEIAE
ncbi:hypothetical protein PHOSAC3_120494 [Mesotoga infera]|nr:hypothetical protein PHOSAC3_120494 [Mesotoga infera]